MLQYSSSSLVTSGLAQGGKLQLNVSTAQKVGDVLAHRDNGWKILLRIQFTNSLKNGMDKYYKFKGYNLFQQLIIVEHETLIVEILIKRLRITIFIAYLLRRHKIR
jgi:hypothetical protein